MTQSSGISPQLCVLRACLRPCLRGACEHVCFLRTCTTRIGDAAAPALLSGTGRKFAKLAKLGGLLAFGCRILTEQVAVSYYSCNYPKDMCVVVGLCGQDSQSPQTSRVHSCLLLVGRQTQSQPKTRLDTATERRSFVRAKSVPAPGPDLRVHSFTSVGGDLARAEVEPGRDSPRLGGRWRPCGGPARRPPALLLSS